MPRNPTDKGMKRGRGEAQSKERDRELERKRENEEDTIVDADLATGTTGTGFSSRTEVGAFCRPLKLTAVLTVINKHSRCLSRLPQQRESFPILSDRSVDVTCAICREETTRHRRG